MLTAVTRQRPNSSILSNTSAGSRDSKLQQFIARRPPTKMTELACKALVSLYKPARSRRFAECNSLVVDRSRTKASECEFVYATSSEWNGMLTTVTSNICLRTVKTPLNTHIFYYCLRYLNSRTHFAVIYSICISLN